MPVCLDETFLTSTACTAGPPQPPSFQTVRVNSLRPDPATVAVTPVLRTSRESPGRPVLRAALPLPLTVRHVSQSLAALFASSQSTVGFSDPAAVETAQPRTG